MQLIDGKATATAIKAEIAEEVKSEEAAEEATDVKNFIDDNGIDYVKINL